MSKTVKIKYSTIAYFDTVVELTDKQFKELKAICKKENPTIAAGSELHDVMAVNDVSCLEFDYMDKDVELEDVEYELFKH